MLGESGFKRNQWMTARTTNWASFCKVWTTRPLLLRSAAVSPHANSQKQVPQAGLACPQAYVNPSIDIYSDRKNQMKPRSHQMIKSKSQKSHWLYLRILWGKWSLRGATADINNVSQVTQKCIICKHLENAWY